MKIFSPQYLLALKKGEVADFTNVSKSELNHYDDLMHYKKTTGIKKVETFEENCKYNSLSVSKNGLYPPEVVLLDEIRNDPRKYPLSDGEHYSDSWWFDFGIVDVLSHIKKLENARLIELENGKYKITEDGLRELDDNGEILWVNNRPLKTSSNGDIWCIKELINRDLSEKHKNDSWQNKAILRYKRIIAANMMEHRLYSVKPAMAELASFYDEMHEYEKSLEVYKELLLIVRDKDPILALVNDEEAANNTPILAPDEEAFVKKKMAECRTKIDSEKGGNEY